MPGIIDCDDLTTDFSEITYDYTGWCIECLLDVVSKRNKYIDDSFDHLSIHPFMFIYS